MNYQMIEGVVYGRLTAGAATGTRNSRREMLISCRCVCGRHIAVPYPRLKSGNTKSCGCLQPEVVRRALPARTHGQCYSGAYGSHRSMMRRCYDRGSVSYKTYGAKGIVVCPRWFGVENFPNFLADMGDRPHGHTLERLNSSGDYEPNNCVWATPAAQARNVSTNRRFTLDGETRILKDWSSLFGVSSTTILDRISRGWDVRSAICTPPKYIGPKLYTFEGSGMTLMAIEEVCGISHKVLKSRIDQGWTLERATTQPVGNRATNNKDKK